MNNFIAIPDHLVKFANAVVIANHGIVDLVVAKVIAEYIITDDNFMHTLGVNIILSQTNIKWYLERTLVILEILFAYDFYNDWGSTLFGIVRSPIDSVLYLTKVIVYSVKTAINIVNGITYGIPNWLNQKIMNKEKEIEKLTKHSHKSRKSCKSRKRKQSKKKINKKK